MKRRAFFFTLFFACVILIDAFFVPLHSDGLNGDGSVGTPYEIGDVADLLQLNSMDSQGKYFQLTGNIDCSGLSTVTKPFEGNLNGQGYALSHLSSPLFAECNNAQISNLSIDHTIATLATDSTISSVAVSGANAVGTLSGGSVSNALVNGGQAAASGTGTLENCLVVHTSVSTFAGTVTNCYYDSTVYPESVTGFTGMTTTALFATAIPGMTNISDGYPYPSGLAVTPFSSFALALSGTDSWEHVTQNITLPATWQGNSISWTQDGQPVSGTTNFAFPLSQTQPCTLIATVNGSSKQFDLVLDRVIHVDAENQDGSPFTNGGKTNQQVTVELSGVAPMEYSLDGGVTFVPYSASFDVQQAVNILIRYQGETDTLSFVVDYLNQAITIHDFADGGSSYLGFVLSQDGFYSLDGAPYQSISAGTLVKSPGTYAVYVQDAYGNRSSDATYTILAAPVASSDLNEVKQAIVALRNELNAAQGVLPEPYLEEMRQQYFALKDQKDMLVAQIFDAMVSSATTDEQVEQLYWYYHAMNDAQKANVQNMEEYDRKIAQLREKRLHNDEYDITVYPLGDLPIDVYLQVEKTKNGFNLSLIRNGQAYYTDMEFIVKMPYRPDYVVYFNGKPVEFIIDENGYAIFRVNGLGETDYRIDDIAAVAQVQSNGTSGTAASQSSGSEKTATTANVLSPGAFALLAAGIFAVAAFLFRMGRNNNNEQ